MGVFGRTVGDLDDSDVRIVQALADVARTHSVDVDTAFDPIRSYARSNNRHLSDVAYTVVTDLASLPGLANPGSR